MRGLYAILDIDTLASSGQEPLAFAERVLRARPAALQLRAKSLEARATLALLGPLQVACSAARVPLFCNDRIDLALIARADGVHVGQHDPPVAVVRRLAPELRVGVSTHDLEQLEAALAERPDYVAFGPVYATQSKRNPDPVVGISTLDEAGRRCRKAGVPLVAIGGITLERASEVSRAADAAAVISALYGGPGTIEERARALHLALGGT